MGGAVVAFDDVELDAAILGATGIGLVRGDRTIRAVALCCQSRIVDTVLNQPDLDAASAALRKVDVVQSRTLAVRMSFNADQADSGCRLQRTGDGLKHREAPVSYTHLHYGVQPRHLTIMGRSLLDAIGELDDEWSDSTARAWSKAYGHIAQALQRGIESVRSTQAMPIRRVGRFYWEVPFAAPQTQWVHRGDGDVAYQVFGQGSHTIVILGEWVTHLEHNWHSLRVASFLRQLASLAQIILLDQRGCGMSSRKQGIFSVDQISQDIRAVLDLSLIHI